MTVRVLMLEAPQALLDERARLGLDRFDEMWDGVLHVVPAPFARHQDIGSQLIAMLFGRARERGTRVMYETGLFRPGRDDDYRVPDVVVIGPEGTSRRGIEGACDAVFEIHSPGDEAYEKVGWYVEVGVREVVIVHRDTLAVELYREVDEDGELVLADDTTLRALDVTFERIDDDHLRLRWPDGGEDAVTL